MDNIIAIRYDGDASLSESQKLSITRHFNRVLAGQKDAIIASNAVIKIIEEKGMVRGFHIFGMDAVLEKIITQKIADSVLPFYNE